VRDVRNSEAFYNLAALQLEITLFEVLMRWLLGSVCNGDLDTQYQREHSQTAGEASCYKHALLLAN
jgi:hypothetical protein